MPASLRPLTTATAATSPQFADFSVLSESEGVRTPRRAFFPATWGPAHLPVTLMVSRDMSLTGSQATSAFSLNPVTQFVDQIPNYLLSTSSQGSGLGTTQGNIYWHYLQKKLRKSASSLVYELTSRWNKKSVFFRHFLLKLTWEQYKAFKKSNRFRENK